MKDLFNFAKTRVTQLSKWTARRGALGVAAVVGVAALILISGVGVTMAATGTLPFAEAGDQSPGFATDGPAPTLTPGKTQPPGDALKYRPTFAPDPNIPSTLWGDRDANFSGIRFASDANGFYVSFGGIISSTQITSYVSYYDRDFQRQSDLFESEIGEQYNVIAVYDFRPDMMCTPGVSQIKVSFKVTGLVGVSTASYSVPLEHYSCPVELPAPSPTSPSSGVPTSAPPVPEPSPSEASPPATTIPSETSAPTATDTTP
jgi:hypothetical protein